MEFRSVLKTIISIFLLQLSVVSKLGTVEATSGLSGKLSGTGSSINGQIKLPAETNVGAAVSTYVPVIGKDVVNVVRDTSKLVNDGSKATENFLQAASSITQATAKAEQNLSGQVNTVLSSSAPITGNIGTNSQIPYHHGQVGRTENINYGYVIPPNGAVPGNSKPSGNTRPGQGMSVAGNLMNSNSNTQTAGISSNGRPGSLVVAGSAPTSGNGREGGSGLISGGYQNVDRGTGQPTVHLDESQSHGGFGGVGSLLGLNAAFQIFGSGRGNGRPTAHPSTTQNRPPPPIGMNSNGRDKGGTGMFLVGFPPIAGGHRWGGTGDNGMQAEIFGNFDFGSGFGGSGQNDGRFQNYGSGRGTGSPVPNNGESYSYSWSESYGDPNSRYEYSSSNGNRPSYLNNYDLPINQNQPGHAFTTGNGGISNTSGSNSPKIPENNSPSLPPQSQTGVQQGSSVNNLPNIPGNKPTSVSQQGQTQLQGNAGVTTGNAAATTTTTTTTGGATSNNNQKTKP